MIKKHMKKYAKSGMALATTGIGLGIGASVMGSAGASAAPISNMASKMGTIGSIVSTGVTLDILQDSMNMKKKKKGFY